MSSAGRRSSISGIRSLGSLPLLVRPNTVLCTGERDDRPDHDYTEGLVLRVYALDPGAVVRTTVVDHGGEPALGFETTLRDDELTVAPVDPRGGRPTGTWSVLLVGTDEVGAVGNGSATRVPEGVRVTPEDPAAPVRVAVPGPAPR